MARLEMITTFAHEETANVPVAENYTHVNGIYGSEVTPQFQTSTNDAQCSVEQLRKAEEAYAARELELRFFRMR